MAKRGATTDLNHDNWDDPLEDEDAGSFKSASDEDLQKRVIKQAKRRLKPYEKSGSSVFARFPGFNKTTAPIAGSNPFGNLLPSPTSTALNSNGTAVTTTTKTEDTPEQTYLSKLQQLNRNVTDWIKTHVDANPVCILTPVFNDYDKHLKKIQSERDAPSTASIATTSSFTPLSSSTSNSNLFAINIPTTSADNSKKPFSFMHTSSSDTSKPVSPLLDSTKESGKSPLLQAGDTSKPTVQSIFKTFNCETTGSSLLTKPDPAALMVNPFLSVIKKDDKPQTAPFSLSNGPAPTSSSNTEEEEEESDQPPKVEIPPIEEENSVFSTRCKVFVKKDSNYKDKGVGTLFIKEVGEEKYQLLVRAETALRSILLNVLLSSGVPTQRMGKNNVMLVCLPTPQDVPPPTTVLLRVKTASDADDLLKTIDQYKH